MNASSSSLPTMKNNNSDSYGISFSKPTWVPRVTIQPTTSATSFYPEDNYDHKVCLAVTCCGFIMIMVFIFLCLLMKKYL